MAKIVVINGPSGSGKTFLSAKLKEMDTSFQVLKAVTDCTRLPRTGEVHGVDYYFRTKEEFESRIANGEYVEYSLYDGTYRGLRVAELERCLTIENAIVLLILDINGVNAIKEKFPNETISVYLKVSKEALETRMRERGDSEENIASRLAYYENAAEDENESKCDYVITNNGTVEDLVNSFIEIVNM